MRIRPREFNVLQFHRFNRRVTSRMFALCSGAPTLDGVRVRCHGSSPWLRGRDAQVRDVITLFIAFMLEVKDTRTAELWEYEMPQSPSGVGAPIPRGVPPRSSLPRARFRPGV